MRTNGIVALLMTLTIMVAAVIFAPSVARAHPGHSHEARPAVAETRSAVQAGAAESRTVQAAPAVKTDEAATISRRSGERTSLLRVHGANAPQTCTGGCCNSVSAGCCVAPLPASFELIIPIPGRASLIVAVIGRTGITPGALPEPPKSLV